MSVFNKQNLNKAAYLVFGAACFIVAWAFPQSWIQVSTGVVNAVAGYTTIQFNGTPVTQRNILNFNDATNTTVVCADNSGASRTDCAYSASGGGGGSGLTLGQFGIGLGSLSDPALFTWTGFNLATANTTILTTTGGQVYVGLATASGAHIAGQTTPITGTSPYTVTAGIILGVMVYTFPQNGLCISDGTKYIMYRIRGDQSTIQIITLTDPNNQNSEFGATSFPVGSGREVFLRIQEGLVNRTYQYSFDGVAYVTTVTEAINTFLTPDRAGPCINTQDTATSQVVNHFTSTAP